MRLVGYTLHTQQLVYFSNMFGIKAHWRKHKGEIIWAAIFSIPASHVYEWSMHGFPINASWVEAIFSYKVPLWSPLVAAIILYLTISGVKRLFKSGEEPKAHPAEQSGSRNAGQPGAVHEQHATGHSVAVGGDLVVRNEGGGVALGIVTGEVHIGLTEEVLVTQLKSTSTQITDRIIEALKDNDTSSVRRLMAELDIVNAQLADTKGTLHEREAELKAAHEKLGQLKDDLPAEQIAHAQALLKKGEVEVAESVFDSLVERGGSHLAQSAFQSGQLAETRFDFHKALQSYQIAAGIEKNAQFWLAAGRLSNILGFYKEAERLLYPLVQQYRSDTSIDSRMLFAKVTNELAISYKEMNNLAASEQLYRESLQAIEPLVGKSHAEIAIRLNNLALILFNRGQFDDAEAMFLEAADILSATVGRNAPQFGGVLMNLASLYVRKSKFEQAEQLLIQAEELFEAGGNRLAYAGALTSRGELYRVRGRLKEAEEMLVKSQHVHSTLLGPEHLEVATVMNNLALVYESMGKYDAVEEMYNKILAIRKKHLGDDHPLVANVLNNMCWFYLEVERFQEAREFGSKALAIRQHVLPHNHPDTANTLNGLGCAYFRLNEDGKAEEYFDRALSIKKEALGPNSHEALPIMTNLGVLYTRTGRFQMAEEILLQDLRLSEMYHGVDGYRLVASLKALGDLYRVQRDYSRSDEFYDRALDILHVHFPNGHPYVEIISNDRKQ